MSIHFTCIAFFVVTAAHKNCVVEICNNGMFLQFYELTLEMKYFAGVHKRHCTIQYMLKYIFRAGDCDMIYWIVGLNLTVDVHKKPYTFTLLNHYTVIMALAFRIIVNKKKAVT